MTKSKIIAGAGVAALGAVILPAVAFAADGTLSQTDTVIVTVDTACSLATSGSSVTPTPSTYTATIANGTNNTNIAGSTFTVTCNDNGGWRLSAVGAGTGTDVSYMDASTEASDDISTGTTFANGGTGQQVSNWAFKVAGNDETAIQGSYDDFSLVPTSAQVVAKNASTATTTTTTTATVTVTYGVGISPTQEAGTYTGKVQYTLAHPAEATQQNNG